jgi:HEAT repeat protein
MAILCGAFIAITTPWAGLYAQPTIPQRDIPTDIDPDVKQCLERLYSPRPEDRARASWDLKNLGVRAAVAAPFLESSLSDMGAYRGIQGFLIVVGREAGEALASVGRPGQEALKRAFRDVDPNVYEDATYGLILVDDDGIVDFGIFALNDKNATIRSRAASFLGMRADPRATPALVAALADTDTDVRFWAALGLGRLKDSRAIEPLIDAIARNRTDLSNVGIANALSAVTGQNLGYNPEAWRAWWTNASAMAGD